MFFIMESSYNQATMQTTQTKLLQPFSQDFSFLKGILNHVQDPVLVKDSEHRFVFLNDAASTFFRVSREDILNKTDYDFFPKEEADVFRLKDKEVFDTGNGNVNEEDLTDAKGNKHIVSTKKSLFINEKGEKFLVLVIRDITEAKNSEKHLLRSIDQLAEFAYVASHDIKSPLRTINSFAKLLNKKFRSEIPEVAHSYVDFIVSASSRANNLVDDILKYSVSMNVEMDLEPIDLESVVAEVKENIKPSIIENNAVVQFDDLPVVSGSKVRLYQLFQNLICNAIKFRREGMNPVIKIANKKLASGFEISVTDNGIGIEAEHLENVFGLFTKLNSPKKYNGSGIGLATCKKIVKEMGGNIYIESVYGEGTSVLVFLPQTKHL